MAIHILHVVDMQVDFTTAGGLLPVPWAEPLNGKMNDFFASVPPGFFDLALFTYDTHFAAEYPFSPESKPFPKIHCEHGTPGWALSVDASKLKGKTPVWHMSKNVFDMWAANPLALKGEKPKFASDTEARAYANLFHVTDDPKAVQMGMPRDEFFRSLGLGRGEDFRVTMMGVAADICVHDAALGYLKYAARVRIVEDLVAGIGTAIPGRAYSGQIKDVLALQAFSGYAETRQVTLTGMHKVHEPFADLV